MSILVFQIFFKIYIYIYLNQIFFKNTYISNSKFWFYDRTNFILLSFFFFFFLIQVGKNQWSNTTEIVRRGNEFKTSLPEMENELSEEWIMFAHSHRVERARAANCRRLSVPFQANPIIRNETASFYGLVQAYLFIRYARTKGVGVEMYRGLAIPLPLLILLVDVQGMAEYTLEPHVRFPLFSDLTVLFVFSCSTYANPTFLLSLYLFHAKFGWCSCVREYEPFVSYIRKHTVGNIADSF